MLARELASFWRENVVAVVILLRVLLAAETSHSQMLKVLAFCDRKMAFKTFSIKIKMRTFLIEEIRTMKLFGASIFSENAKNPLIKSRSRYPSRI